LRMIASNSAPSALPSAATESTARLASAGF